MQYLLLFLLLPNLVVSNEKQLRQDLFTNYSTSIIPKYDHSEPINVEMGMAIQTLEEFNQKVENIKLPFYL